MKKRGITEEQLVGDFERCRKEAREFRRRR
jgi:hypothetical protein